MRPDRWRTIEGLYQSAVDLPDAERDSFLQQECGHDDTLLLEVKSLLKHSSSSGNLLDGSAIAILAEDFAVDESQAGGVFEQGKTISHYRILENIGRGGMSVVYKAGDLKLGRPVALKFLPSYLSQDPQSLLRFEREARAASALNHPNICTIYEIDQYEGSHFISMEWLQGESLDARMARGRLQIPEILGIATDVSHALEVAHFAGIIHRDVKPANIFLTQTGAAKVLDFGVAKRLSKEPDDLDRPPSVSSNVGRDLTLTLPGAPLGTAGYMSPEQAAGLRVDPRSDIFSMGVVLYQMTTGKLPFDGKSPADLIRGVQSEAHAPISELDPKAPPALSRIIHKALQKDPSLRYENAAEMRADLQELRRHLEKNENGRRAILIPAIVLSLLAVAAAVVVRVPHVHEWTARKSSAIAPSETKSLAVLPFANLTGSPAQEYFVDGMTDALTTNLAQIKSLRVTSLSSVMGYKDINKTPSDIAKELKVDALVEGSVVRSGDSVRIDVQLIRARDGHNVWARTYNRRVNNVLALQNEVARAVASEIQVELTPQEQSRFAMAQTVDPEAYQLYLRGRYCWNKRTDDGYNKAIEFFQRALAIQPDYPQAYAGLADSYAMLGTWKKGGLSRTDTISLARSTALKAIELDDTLAEAHASLASISYVYDWDWPLAEKEFHRAIQLNPSYASAHHWYAYYCFSRVRIDEGLREIRLAQQLDPQSLIIHNDVGQLLYTARRYDEAIEEERRTLEMDESLPWPHRWLGLSYLAKQDYAQAIRELQIHANRSNNDPGSLALLGMVYARAGRREDAQQILQQIQALPEEQRSLPDVAWLLDALGEHDEAFALLERVFPDRPRPLKSIHLLPYLDPLRPDPRFQDLQRRVGLAP